MFYKTKKKLVVLKKLVYPFTLSIFLLTISTNLHAQRGGYRGSKTSPIFEKLTEEEKGQASKELQKLLKLGGGVEEEHLSIDVQTIVTQLRKPKLNIVIKRPFIDIPVDDTKLGKVKHYIDEKANQTFYKIKIDEMNVTPIE